MTRSLVIALMAKNFTAEQQAALLRVADAVVATDRLDAHADFTAACLAGFDRYSMAQLFDMVDVITGRQCKRSRWTKPQLCQQLAFVVADRCMEFTPLLILPADAAEYIDHAATAEVRDLIDRGADQDEARSMYPDPVMGHASQFGTCWVPSVNENGLVVWRRQA